MVVEVAGALGLSQVVQNPRRETSARFLGKAGATGAYRWQGPTDHPLGGDPSRTRVAPERAGRKRELTRPTVGVTRKPLPDQRIALGTFGSSRIDARGPSPGVSIGATLPEEA